jgi:hypothetical protein
LPVEASRTCGGVIAAWAWPTSSTGDLSQVTGGHAVA